MISVENEDEVMQAIPVEEIEAQLARMLESQHFRHSQRYPALLRFLVKHVCSERSAPMKERLIGIEVFHRAPDYDTNVDPVVRVTAAEVRKRIAQYYQEPGRSQELRIDLPTGTYVPRFVRPAALPTGMAQVPEVSGEAAATVEAVPAEARAGEDARAEESHTAAGLERDAATEPSQARSARGRRRVPPLAGWVLAAAAVCLGALLTLAGFWVRDAVMGRRTAAVRRLWGPIASSDAPVLLVLGSHNVDLQGQVLRSKQGAPASPDQPVLQVMRDFEQIPLSDVSSLFRLNAFLVQQHQEYREFGAGAADIADLREGPVVLFGGFGNRWTMRLTQQLRYRFVGDPTQTVGALVDAQAPGRRWQVDFSQPYRQMSMDYAIVARYFDPMIEEPVLIVAGVGATGTRAASDFVTDERLIEAVDRMRPHGSGHDNMELVLAMQVVDGKAGPPHVVASQFW